MKWFNNFQITYWTELRNWVETTQIWLEPRFRVDFSGHRALEMSECKNECSFSSVSLGIPKMDRDFLVFLSF